MVDITTSIAKKIATWVKKSNKINENSKMEIIRMLYFNIHPYMRFQVSVCVFGIYRSANFRDFFFPSFSWHLQRIYYIRCTGIKEEYFLKWNWNWNIEIPRYIIIFLMYQRQHLLIRDTLTENILKVTEDFFFFNHILAFIASQKCTWYIK